MLVESKSEKLSFENNQLVKKNVELDQESQEINKKFQALQVIFSISYREFVHIDSIDFRFKCQSFNNVDG